jgi:predicted O-linked N-acetylglucosamine transferase (SPINDLY family)
MQKSIITRAIALKPNDPRFHNNIGAAYRALQKPVEAMAHYHRALTIQPDLADIYNNLGLILQDLGKLDEAITNYRRALGLNPSFLEAHNNLGNALRQKGDLAEAVICHCKTLVHNPENAEAHNNLGVALHDQGKLQEGIAHLRRALALRPLYPEAYNNLGNALLDQGQIAQAVDQYRKALELQPGLAVAARNLGVALQQMGKVGEAVAWYHKALALDPKCGATYNNLGLALQEVGHLEDAVAQHQKAIAIRPEFPEAHNNLGIALKDLGRLEDAIAHLRQALNLRPAYPEAYNNLGNALKDGGVFLAEAIESFKKALAVNSNYVPAHSNLLFCLHYHPEADPATLFAHHQDWNARHARPLAGERRPFGNRREPGRPLHLGYVSADFRRHPVGYFLAPVFRAHDKAHFRVSCFSMVLRGDDLTARLRAQADAWHSIVGMPDAAVAELIRAEGVDILIDLSGHTAGNRLLVFARKPAPVQVTWIGYFDTTGLETMDYVITDSFLSPLNTPQRFTEALVRLPPGYVCYQPPAYAPPVAPAPVLTRGAPTLGCFNNLSKVNAQVVALWAQILHRVPEARIVLKAKALIDPPTREAYARRFQEHGIAPDRVALLGSSSHGEYLGAYGDIDLALDPFPFTGGLTTCEALWMGVPVVTLAGPTLVSRMGVSYLARVGLAELIAHSPEEYVDLVVRLSQDPERLAQLRAELRPRMAASPLCDGPSFTRHLEAAYQRMWDIYVRGGTPREFERPKLPGHQDGKSL